MINKTVYKIFLFGVTSIVFFSCKQESGLSITKRHYRDGFFVERSHAKQIESKNQESKFISAKRVEKTVIPSKQMLEVELKESVIAKNESSFNGNNNVRSTHTSKPLLSNSSNSESLNQIISNNEVENNRMEYKRTILTKSSSGHHSLLWIIIVVLLILWGISFLSGAGGGGLLWLLLVIALILLILRLLGVM